MDIALTSYRAALDSLFARVSGGWKLGLDTTRALLESLGNPQLRFPVFHVGGTNGKGSVVATIDALLRAEGLRVGRYTSPHLIDFRERIAVDGETIDEASVLSFLERWMPEVERLGATFFEVTTCMALDHFARQAVDVAVLEVGLGGRLDATNVVTPLVAGVTSIGLDHVQYLGDTVDQIAREKAGIFKGGRPAVIGEQDPAVRALLAELAAAAGASPVCVLADSSRIEDVTLSAVGTCFTLRTVADARQLCTPLLGRHQAMNAAVALAMLEQAGEPYAAAARHAESALSRVAIPGRFQRCGDVIFDVAHNPAGTAVLCETLDELRPARPLSVLLTVLRDKDWRTMMALLAHQADRIVLTAPPSVPADRAWVLEEAVEFAHSAGWNVIAERDFDRALELARAGAATTLITGSFHTVGDAMARLPLTLSAA